MQDYGSAAHNTAFMYPSSFPPNLQRLLFLFHAFPRIPCIPNDGSEDIRNSPNRIRILHSIPDHLLCPLLIEMMKRQKERPDMPSSFSDELGELIP
jgi:hypothetical protein